MEPLSRISGLDLQFDAKKHSLVIGKGITKVNPAVRYLKEMKEVLVDKGLSVPQELYYMYRDLHKETDEKAIRKARLRYDLTIIRPDKLGEEFMKTAGHYHPGAYGELYEVLYGEAWCLMQKAHRNDHKIIEDVILVKAKAGDKIVIPPYYGHILINVKNGHLITSNWVSSEFSSEYELYKKAQGAAYFIFEDNLGERFQINPYYKEASKIRIAKPANSVDTFGLSKGKPMYPMLYKEVLKLDFLNNPLKYDYSRVFDFA